MKKKIVIVFLAIFCFSQSAPLRAEPVLTRTLRIGIVASENFRKIPNWRPEFERRLAYASRIFESEFKIRLVPAVWYEWRLENEGDELRNLLEDLKFRYPLKNIDVMIGLAYPRGLKQVKDLHAIGQARPFSGYLVLRYPMTGLYKIQEETVLAHELGHLFGAIHSSDPKSIMAPVVDKQLPSRFDNENHEIIALTRDIDFQKGIETLPEGILYKLLGSYLKMARTEQPFDFYYNVGILYLNLGQYDNAVKIWQKAAALEPNYGGIHYDLGMLYLRIGKEDLALRELSQAVSLFSHPGQNEHKGKALKALGDSYMLKKNYLAAYNAYSRALVLLPGDFDLRVNLAAVLMKRGQFDSAIREFDNLLRKDPGNLKALVYIGQSYYETGRLREADRYIRQALAKTNDRELKIEIYNYLGKINLKLGKTNEAVENFRMACSLSPSLECLKGLAHIHFQAGQWDDTIRELAKVLQIEKTDPDVYGALGVAFMQKGDYENAIPILREGIRYAKDDPTAAKFYKNIGYILINRKHYDLAEKEFQMAAMKDFSNVEIHFGLALAYLGSENLIAAKKSLENVLRLQPNHARAREMYAQINKTLSQQVLM